MFNLGLYFKALDLTKTKVLLGSTKFCGSKSLGQIASPLKKNKR